MFSQIPPSGPGEVSFRIGPFPVRITPMFWITGLFLGIYSAPQSLAGMVAWMAAFLSGILLHELGHAVVMRWFGDRPMIVLLAFGGITYAGDYPRWNTTWTRSIATHFAGPLAGFLFVALLCGLSVLSGESILVVGHPVPFVPVPFAGALIGAPEILVSFLISLVMICIWWGILNLTPILPLDGGQISLEIFRRFSPATGTMRAVQVSLIFAVFMVLWFIQRGGVFGAVIFGMFAFQSFQLLAGMNRRPF
ncbi:MAG: hypothetical protein Q4C47_09060 [Planctomycetia bacterium]|nr:hypothetical protein [Planctomycetia bacterium]